MSSVGDALTATHRAIVHAATLAPSVHNSQPWRFTAHRGDLDLHADSARRLPVLDPAGRLVHVSCGAALLNAQVAARALGLHVEPLLMPDPADPSHLARLHLTPGAPATDAEHALAAAIALRHTHRDAFEQRTLPPELLEQLRGAAEEHGAALLVVTGDDLIELEVLLAWADGVQEADPEYRAETVAHVRTAPAVDGIPAAALAGDPERGSSLRLRDFAFTGPQPGHGEPPRAEKPDVVLITTDHDDPLSWLRAGQAVEAVLLHAAQHGVMGQPLAQVTDFPAGRVRLRKALGLVGVPQMALRLGYAAGTAPTPRRAVDDVLATTPERRDADLLPEHGAPKGSSSTSSPTSSLTALSREHLERARTSSSGRSACTVHGGHAHTLRQTVIALLGGQRLGEHENPGEATVHVLQGRVRLGAGDDHWDGAAGDLLVVPDCRHDLEALEDSVVLLTVAKHP